MKVKSKIVIFLTLAACFLLPETFEFFETKDECTDSSEFTAFTLEMIAVSDQFSCVQDTLYINLEQMVQNDVLIAYGIEVNRNENSHQQVFLSGWIKTSFLSAYVYGRSFNAGIRLSNGPCSFKIFPDDRDNFG